MAAVRAGRSRYTIAHNPRSKIIGGRCFEVEARQTGLDFGIYHVENPDRFIAPLQGLKLPRAFNSPPYPLSVGGEAEIPDAMNGGGSSESPDLLTQAFANGSSSPPQAT